MRSINGSHYPYLVHVSESLLIMYGATVGRVLNLYSYFPHSAYMANHFNFYDQDMATFLELLSNNLIVDKRIEDYQLFTNHTMGNYMEHVSISSPRCLI